MKIVLLLVSIGILGAADNNFRATVSFPGSKAASTYRPAVVLPGDDALPQVANGAGWKTSIILVNLSAIRKAFVIDFWRPNGTEWPINIVGVGTGDRFSGALSPGGSVTIDTDGLGSLTQGWAELTYDNNSGTIGGMAILRQTVPGRPDFEAVVPFTTLFERQTVLVYDNTVGFSTGAALANGSTQNPITVAIDYRDETGAIYLTESITLAPKGQIAFSIPTRNPTTQGRRGTAFLRSTSDFLSVLGLRFNPGGAFTSLHTLTSIDMIR